jgi:hypothetical protein
MKNVNRAGATTSMITKRRPSVQNPKYTERHTVLPRKRLASSLKT